jgi:hypothetical protein
VDATDPTVQITGCPTTDVAQGSTQSITVTASDAHSGLATNPSGNVSLDTSSIGQKTKTVTAVDNVGRTATKTCTYTVIYNWTGFFQPVDNAPTLNVVKSPAGKAAIQVRFSLGSNMGLDIFDQGYPVVKSTGCPSQSPTDVVEQTVAAEPSNLRYDASANQYIYTWKTESAWKGTCRELNLRLKDGTDHKALFQFTK